MRAGLPVAMISPPPRHTFRVGTEKFPTARGVTMSAHPDGIPCLLDENCPLRRAFDLFADRWTPTVLAVLADGPRRYSDIQRTIPDLSKKMLTQTLREVVRGGLVAKRADAAGPGRAEYELTPLGRWVLEPILALGRWAAANADLFDAVAAHRNAGRPYRRGGA